MERQLALPLDPTAETPELAEPTEWEEMLANYRRTSLSVDVHPMELIRPHLPKVSFPAMTWARHRKALR